MDEDEPSWDICRTCGGEAEISIFAIEGIEMQLEEKINAYLPITVSSSDDLPLAMCRECVDRLESCHQIVTSCIEMEAQLRQVIKLEEISELNENSSDVIVEPCQNTLEHKQPDTENEPKEFFLQNCSNEFDNSTWTFMTEESNQLTTNSVRPKSLQSKQCNFKNNIDQDCTKQIPINVIVVKPCQNSLVQNQTEEKNLQDHVELNESAQTLMVEDNNKLSNSVRLKTLQSKQYNLKNNNKQDHAKQVRKIDKHKIYRRFACDLCNKNLSSKLALTLHLRTHSGERPYKCQYCHRKFSQRPALKYHERSHTGERPYVCSYCGKGYSSKVVRDTHVRVHTGERPYCCEECGASFRCISNLRQHQAIHSQGHQFMCHICGKHFCRPEKVRIHMRTHTGERPYSCPICKRAFTQKGDMMKHTVIHNNSKNKHFKETEVIKVESDMIEVTVPTEVT